MSLLRPVRETGEPKPPMPKPPHIAPAVPGLTETVEHYLERLKKWRLNCLKVIIVITLIFFGGAVLYLKGDPEIAMPVVILGASMYFIAPRLFEIPVPNRLDLRLRRNAMCRQQRQLTSNLYL